MSMSDEFPTQLMIDPLAAAHDLQGVAARTPVRRLNWLERIVGVPVFAKMECFQHTGSFKYRGARLAVGRAPDRPLMAASAGNHGLAVAHAAAELGRRVDICIPTTASRLKRDRIIATGAGLIEHGNSLEDAEHYTRAIAASRDALVISPYNHPDVIAGSSTIALEILDEIATPATVIVPVGGGGLISGLALGMEARAATPTLIGCEPERYSSATESLRARHAVHVVHQPTFADGLAVNIEQDSLTLDIMRHAVDRIVTLTEEELAAGTLALLVHESVLVEPAGAASVIACLRLAEEGVLDGPVVVPLCGGNLHHTTLARVQHFPFTDPSLVRLCELRGRRILDEQPSVSRLPVPDVAAASRLRRDHFLALLSSALDLVVRARSDVLELSEYLLRRDVDHTPSHLEALVELANRVERELQSNVSALERADGSISLAEAEASARWGVATAAHIRTALEWCSPSYAQARTLQFFQLGAQDSPGVNYERHGHTEVAELESQLLDALGLDPETTSVLMTSSGMSAYSLVESFLLRHRLPPGGRVLLAPYIYFEAAEQLETLQVVTPARASGYEVGRIVEDVIRCHPQVLFADPIANTVEQRMVDLEKLADELERVQHPVTLVVDGTMISGAVSPALIGHRGVVEVLYYESCSKYLQLGLDASLAGLVAAPSGLRPAFERIRRNSGTILTRHGAALFPRYVRARLMARMGRIHAGVLQFVASLLADHRLDAIVDVIHPSSPSHPDHELASRFEHLGGCVTFRLRAPGANNPDQLEGLVDALIAEACVRRLPLTKGVSFGFTVPRVSAAASMAESEAPFLRLYIGDQDASDVDRLAALIGDVLAREAPR